MAGKKKKPHRDTPYKPAPHEVTARRTPDGNGWELVHPSCATARVDDIAEVESMLEAGEEDVAVDELRWLLTDCSDFITAHRMLGETALAAGDLALARGHFGHGYRVGVKALSHVGTPSPLEYQRAANQDFFQCGKGLAHCLIQLDKKPMAKEVVRFLLRCDPADPLGVAALVG